MWVSHSNFKRKVKRKINQDIEPHEVFLDTMSEEKEGDHKIEVPLSAKILRWFLVVVFFVFASLFIKTFQFQVLEKEKYSVLAESNKFIFHSIKAERGVIYDSQGEQIVFNEPGYDLIYVKKNGFPEAERKRDFSEIASVAGINPEDKIEKDESLIIRNIDHKTLISLETRIDELEEFEIQKRAVRKYKDGEVFSHIIGYTGKISEEDLEKSKDYSLLDFTGRSGIEKTYEDYLKKKAGKLRMERNALGDILSEKVVSFAESGNSLKLWLNADLQRKIYETLSKKLEDLGASKAVAVALNPNNGGVLSMVSLPSFDNNIFSKTEENSKEIVDLLSAKENPLFNRVVSGQYATGSIIKPLIALAVLEEGIIAADKKINCTGKISIPHRYDPEITYEYKDWSVHGMTDLGKAIAESCNVYFYTVGGGYKEQEGLGPSKIKEYLNLFNWAKKTNIDIPGEEEGFIPSSEWKEEVKGEGWWDGDTYNLSIGQGDMAITPLQVAVSFVAIANGGTLYKPQVVKEIVEGKEIDPLVLKSNLILIDKDNLQAVREGMRRGVTGVDAPQASSMILNSLPVSAAAKTGTAQTPLSNHHHNWVTVFAPYENPEIVLTIMIENVKDVQAAVLPVAREVLNYYFKDYEK